MFIVALCRRAHATTIAQGANPILHHHCATAVAGAGKWITSRLGLLLASAFLVLHSRAVRRVGYLRSSNGLRDQANRQLASRCLHSIAIGLRTIRWTLGVTDANEKFRIDYLVSAPTIDAGH